MFLVKANHVVAKMLMAVGWLELGEIEKLEYTTGNQYHSWWKSISRGEAWAWSLYNINELNFTGGNAGHSMQCVWNWALFVAPRGSTYAEVMSGGVGRVVTPLSQFWTRRFKNFDGFVAFSSCTLMLYTSGIWFALFVGVESNGPLWRSEKSEPFNTAFFSR